MHVIKAFVKVIVNDLNQLFALTKLLFARLGGVKNGFWNVGCQKAEHAYLACQAEHVAHANKEQSARCNAVEVNHRHLCDHSNNVIKEYEGDDDRNCRVRRGSEFKITANSRVELFVRKNGCRYRNNERENGEEERHGCSKCCVTTADECGGIQKHYQKEGEERQ